MSSIAPVTKRIFVSPRLGARARGGGEVEIGNARAGRSGVRELLGQHHRGVAGPAAGDQDMKRFVQIQQAAVEIVGKLQQMAGRAGNQTRRLVTRITRWIGITLVLGVNRRRPARVNHRA
jgi:hypothetical protein